jgi:hypothetical protein
MKAATADRSAPRALPASPGMSNDAPPGALRRLLRALAADKDALVARWAQRMLRRGEFADGQARPAPARK